MENSISATSVSVPERNGESSGPEAAFVSPRSEELTEAALAGAAPVGKLFPKKTPVYRCATPALKIRTSAPPRRRL